MNRLRSYESQRFYAIMLLIFLQSYWFIGQATHDRIEEVMAQLESGNGNDSSLSDEEKSEAMASLLAAQEVIDQWNGVWYFPIQLFQKILGSQTEPISIDTGSAAQDKNSFTWKGQFSAVMALTIMSFYILPFLYGWLGAILRVLNHKDSLGIMPGYVGTGAVAGSIIGIFVQPDVLKSTLPEQTAPSPWLFWSGTRPISFFWLSARSTIRLKP